MGQDGRESNTILHDTAQHLSAARLAAGVKPHMLNSCRLEAGNLPAVANVTDASEASFFFPLFL